MEFLCILLFSPLSWKFLPLGSRCSVRLPHSVKTTWSCWVATACPAGGNHKTHKPATEQPTQLFGIFQLSWLVYPALHRPGKWAHSILRSCILFSFSRQVRKNLAKLFNRKDFTAKLKSHTQSFVQFQHFHIMFLGQKSSDLFHGLF